MTKQDLIAKAQELIAAPMCYSELRTKAQAWIDSVGKADEKSKAQALVDELAADVTPIDNLVAFAHSDHAAKIFGDKAAGFAAHADELKASGAKYCDCAACAPGTVILENKAVILG